VYSSSSTYHNAKPFFFSNSAKQPTGQISGSFGNLDLSRFVISPCCSTDQRWRHWESDIGERQSEKINMSIFFGVNINTDLIDTPCEIYVKANT